jgi:hypothetical protein
VRSARAFTAHTLRAVNIIIRDGRIPRPLRWGGAVGIAPLPGPLDEAVLLLVAGVLWLFYRDRLAEAWQQAATPYFANPPRTVGTTLSVTAQPGR